MHGGSAWVPAIPPAACNEDGNPVDSDREAAAPTGTEMASSKIVSTLLPSTGAPNLHMCYDEALDVR